VSLYKFEQNDVFKNRIKTHPRIQFLINDKKTYYNRDILALNSYTLGDETIHHTPQGFLSLYEMNINRDETGHSPPTQENLIYPFITKQGSLTSFKTISTETFQSYSYGDIIRGEYPLSSSIDVEYQAASSTERPHIKSLKNTFNYYRLMSPHYAYESSNAVGTWNKAEQEIKLVSVPSIFYGSSIKKGTVDLKFYITGSLAARLQDTSRNGELIQTFGPSGASAVGEVGFNNSFESSYDDKRIILENASGVSKTFIFDASGTEGSTGTVDGSGFIVVQIDGYEGDNAAIGTEFAIAVESVSGFQISTSDNTFGVITLTQDVAGTSGNTTIQDPDSILDLFIVQFAGGAEGNNGKVAGVVLYNEGFVSLTGSWDLSNTYTDEFLDSGVNIAPKWTLWGQKFLESNPAAPEFCPSSSWSIDCEGTNYVPVITMLAHAKMGELNHSNNPTYVKPDSDQEVAACVDVEHDVDYYENDKRELANVVKSPYPNTSGSFEKTTYISKVGIYDENKNLIAIAKLATPVKKTISREYTFKMKVDF
jgi:hypothetical protein